MSVESPDLQARARVYAALGEPARLAIVDALTLGDASPGEIAQLLELPTNLVAHHVKVLQEAGVVARSRSEGDRRHTYLRVVSESLAGLIPSPLRAAPRVVFVCTRNSARSELAAALWPHRSRIPVASAGTRPAIGSIPEPSASLAATASHWISTAGPSMRPRSSRAPIWLSRSATTPTSNWSVRPFLACTGRYPGPGRYRRRVRRYCQPDQPARGCAQLRS